MTATKITPGLITTLVGATGLPAASGWQFVSLQTASSDTSIAWEGFEAGYDYQIVCHGLDRTADGSTTWQVGVGATPTYRTVGYAGHHHGGFNNGANVGNNLHNSATFTQTTTNNGGATAGEEGAFCMTIINPNEATYFTNMFGFYWGSSSTSNVMQVSNFGMRHEVTEAVTAVKMTASAGNFPTGDMFLYRRLNS